jgi:hypothetical protein
MSHEWYLRIRSFIRLTSLRQPDSKSAAIRYWDGFGPAWILYFPASDVIVFLNRRVRKFRTPGCPGDRIWHGIASYCVSSVFSFCIGLFGSQTDTISRYFAMNRTFFNIEHVLLEACLYGRLVCVSLRPRNSVPSPEPIVMHHARLWRHCNLSQ